MLTWIKKNIYLILFTLPLSIPAIILGVKGIQDIYHSQQVRWWNPVTATVDSVYTNYASHHLNNHSQEVEVYYSYQIIDQKYSSSLIAFGYIGSNIYKNNKAIYQVLSKAKTIQAYVNPASPTEAVIAKGLNNFILLHFIPLILLISIFSYKWLFKNGLVTFLIFILLLALFAYEGFDISNQITVLS
jgi:hypothetical protein